jgi:Xaa-Pro aminopeptidase
LERDNAAANWIGDVRPYFDYTADEHPVVWMAHECGAQRLGIDSLSHELFTRLSPDIEITPTSLMEPMRRVKAPEELSLIRQAAAYADTCLEYLDAHAADIIRGGGTELDILRACQSVTTSCMQDELGDIFEPNGALTGTVISGPRTAIRHGRPLERAPQPGETLIADFRATVGGYHAESGATFILGQPTGEQVADLHILVACQDAALAALRPGISCAEVNAAALDALRAAGLEAAIRHHLGHGIGLETYESPWLASGDNTVIAPHMVFTTEPGIYRPGTYGCRVTNAVIVTEGAAEIASHFLTGHPPEQCVIPL